MGFIIPKLHTLVFIFTVSPITAKIYSLLVFLQLWLDID